MAISKSGLLGYATGKIGNVVFYMLNGQLVSRTIGRQRKPTKAQLANRQRMAVTMKMLKPMQDFIKPGFELKAKGTTCNSFNLATSYNKKHALTGEYPNIRVDYSQVLLSSGVLPGAEQTCIIKTTAGVEINWEANHPGRYAYDDDLVMVVLYFPLSEDSRSYLNAGRREDGKCFIPVNDQVFLNGPIEAYLCFKSADGERISDSIYLGNLNGSAEEGKETQRIAQEKEQYETIKTRFKQVESMYLKFHNDGSDKTRKSFKSVEKEYQVLLTKLQKHPGKPG